MYDKIIIEGIKKIVLIIILFALVIFFYEFTFKNDSKFREQQSLIINANKNKEMFVEVLNRNKKERSKIKPDYSTYIILGSLVILLNIKYEKLFI